MSTDKEYLDKGSLDFSDDFFGEEEKTSNQEKEEPVVTEISKTAKKELKKYKGRENVTSVQRKKKSDADKAQKKLISISEKNKKVLEILKNLDSKYTSESEYICQAIIEKYEKDQEAHSKSLKDSIREVLEEMVGDNFIVMKSSSDINIGTPIQTSPPTQEIKENVEDDESASLIRGALDMWDED